MTPVDFLVYVSEGAVTITTVGSSHMSDRDLWVCDSAFLPLFTFGNDDAPGTTSSALTRVFAAGTYYLAITDSNLVNDQASTIGDANRNGNVFDFHDALAASSPATDLDLTFSITDVVRESSMILVMTAPFEVRWVRFVVLPHTYSMYPFCAGDGHAGSEPCPCGNDGTANGHGCAGLPNQSGAYLDAIGIPSVTGDTILLHCQDLPPGSAALFFQGSSLPNGGFGSVFGAGLQCAGVTQTRRAVRQVDPQGDAEFGFGQPGDPAIHAAGGVPVAGGPLVHRVWYRSHQGPCGNRSNTSNGWAIDRGHRGPRRARPPAGGPRCTTSGRPGVVRPLPRDVRRTPPGSGRCPLTHGEIGIRTGVLSDRASSGAQARAFRSSARGFQAYSRRRAPPTGSEPELDSICSHPFSASAPGAPR